jgi:hypothetical protein
MWLPTPIYERVPQFWLLLGLLFMTSGTYLGFEYMLSFAYFGVGAFCAVWSVMLFVKRARYRNNPVRKPIPTIRSAEELEAEANQAQESEQSESPATQPS